MRTKQVNLPIEVILNLLRSLDPQTKEEIFEEIFIESDSAPLSLEEEKDLKKAMKEYERGETIRWTASE